MEFIKTNKAPEAIGPYSQAIKANGFIFCSGQIPLNTEGLLVNGDSGRQTAQVCENLKNVLESAGSSLEKVIKTTIYLKDLNDFFLVNEVYANFFPHKPARATVEVAALPKGAMVEIECVALE
ncbi:hypothetical protein A2483_01440 [Candidatus Peregrinibacteria bacterium RIFOXYC2_FULL_33_13]|nr:MAG: hypothetical protein UR27_C0001G0039 [Candidatus Peregrinibacteria bacterium GW2011_GWA2_33_10]KKP39769.1 MAG: hypothetical protein UR30_C0008G0038 [Candidatus Peregrinibacteria bacterium GW2011_GWC2_33_13]OGJ50356.1 MAG: hypothetical protein A2229_04365 [Candidatus Peregrinibacteria bacterium RIFOXYA2_FULL_33_7]OGJ53036.1 MAG: hypothetical protein A2483_01440 [Candidatus Peregrinibacteria bacterium RIFOXYC2_FULL_33_13]